MYVYLTLLLNILPEKEAESEPHAALTRNITLLYIVCCHIYLLDYHFQNKSAGEKLQLKWLYDRN